ncbi:MAG TPA: hypothetical protein DCE44_09975, partial [Verrucomicrobiales bacterium]|nr:hypothetical protein [Verrucomicrobiales bacterium]
MPSDLSSFRPSLFFLLISFAAPAWLHAAEQPTAKSEVVPIVVERGPHHRVEETVETIVDELGQTQWLTNRYTVISPGSHYLVDGEWRETVAAFEPVLGGWIARQGPHHVALAEDLEVAGAVEVVSAEGVRLRSTPVQLVLQDRASGETVLLGELQSAKGEQVENGTVLYRNAFSGFPADVRVVYAADRVECDVILRARLPRPELLGLDPANTDFLVLTELFETVPTASQEQELPVAREDASRTRPNLQLEFGSLLMERGSAFRYEDRPERPPESVPVTKRRWQADGRDFLEESAAFEDLQPLLEELPEAGYSPYLWERTRDTARGNPPARPSAAGRRPDWSESAADRREVASRDRLGSAHLGPLTAPGVVVDWSVVTAVPDQLFKGDSTYYVTNSVTLTGTVTFEGGTVIKYSPGGAAGLILGGNPTNDVVNWEASTYRPIIFTGRDDNSVGDVITGSTGALQGTYAGTALFLNGAAKTVPAVLANLAVRHAQVGVSAVNYYPTKPLTVRHVQFLNCNGALKFQLGSSVADSYFVENALVVGGTTVFKDLYFAHVVGSYLTVDGTSSFRQSQYNPDNSSVTLASSVLVNMATTPTCNSPDFDCSSTFHMYIAPTMMFESAGQGAHYIPANSPLWNLAGFGGVPSYPDWQNFTGLKPEILSGSSSATQVYGPRPPPSGPTSQDRLLPGYRYPKLDFIVSNLSVSGTLTFTNGIAVGLAGNTAITLNSTASFKGTGLPGRLNRLVRLSAVQELPTLYGASGTSFSAIYAQSSGANVDLRFTEFGFLAGSTSSRNVITFASWPLYTFSLRDCQVHNAVLSPCAGTLDVATVNLINNLFVRSSITCSRYSNQSGISQVTVTMRNNLHRLGVVNLVDVASGFSAPLWSLKDSLFDASTFTATGPSATAAQISHNGYVGSTPPVSSGSNKTGLTADYAPGAYGPYPAGAGSSPSLSSLREVGSVLATVRGLYHFTTDPSAPVENILTQTDERQAPKEGVSQVDIGFHYAVAPAPYDKETGFGGLDSELKSAYWDDDSNPQTPMVLITQYAADGIPDWIEDTDGDGNWDTTETSWLNPDTDGDGLGDWDELLFGSNPWVANADGETIPDNDPQTPDPPFDDSDELEQGTDPLISNGTILKASQLQEWNFTAMAGNPPLPTPTQFSDSGLQPASQVSTPPEALFDGHAAVFNASTTGVLKYPVNSSTFTLQHGSLHFVYVPAWYLGNSTDQPGAECRLFECGTWSLSVSANGRALVFRVPKAGGGTRTAYVTSLPRDDEQNLTHRRAYEVDLAWTRGGVWMKVNSLTKVNEFVAGAGMGDGGGVDTAPTGTEMVFGSTASGTLRAQGWLDQVQSFNAISLFDGADGDLSPKSWAKIRFEDDRRSQVLSASQESTGLRLKWVRGWEGDPAKVPNNYKIERRELPNPVWADPPWENTGLGNVFDHSKLDPLVTSPSTAGVREGKYFEYRVNRNGKPAATTVAAWKGALADNRGHAILLIDENLLTDIAASVAILKQDLITDGWTVTDLPVKRHIDLAYPYPTQTQGLNYISQTVPLNKANQIAIKKTIRDTVAAHAGVPNVVYLIGHVTVPYSGLDAAEDGHADHAGAWPADSWYGDLSWEQSGSTVNWNPDPPTPVEWPDSATAVAANINNNKYLNYNYPNDGKFDRSTLPPEVPLTAQAPSLPGRLEVAVGRIDFQFMDPYLAAGENLAQTERRLLNNYLGKIHRYRRGDPSIAYADDAVMQLMLLHPGILNSARRLAPRQWGTELFDNDDDVFLQTSDHLWGIHEDVGHHAVFGNVPDQTSPRFHFVNQI